MSTEVKQYPDAIECPLCLGEGTLKRADLLQRLGMKDFTRVAQLSAEEAIRLLLKNEREGEQTRWAKFESELTKRVAEATAKYNAEVQMLQTEKNALTVRLQEFERNTATVIGNAKQKERLDTEKEVQDQIADMRGRIKELESEQKLADARLKTEITKVKTTLESELNSERAKAKDLSRHVEDYLAEIGTLRERNQQLSAEMAKVARVGKKEEMEFADEARTWPGIYVSEKLSKYGDYMLAYRDPSGAQLEPHMLVDNKDKTAVTEGDIDKLVRDAKERSCPVAALVTREETQLRAADKETRWACKDGIWILRTTRQWLPRDLEVLKPLFETMRTEGTDFLTKNSQLAEEVRRTFADLDQLEKQLKKAADAIEGAQTLTNNYRSRLETLCETATSKKVVARVVLTPPMSPAAKKQT